MFEKIKDRFHIGWVEYFFEEKHYADDYLLHDEIFYWLEKTVPDYFFKWDIKGGTTIQDEKIRSVLFKYKKDLMFFKLKFGW